jgi:hypothetical protein
MAKCKSIHGSVIWQISKVIRDSILIQSGVGVPAKISKWMRFDKIPAEQRSLLVAYGVIKVYVGDDGNPYMVADLTSRMPEGGPVFADVLPEELEATDEDALLAITKYIEINNAKG